MMSLYNDSQKTSLKTTKHAIFIFLLLINTYSEADSKIWHAHPVWFIDDNPIVGYIIKNKASGFDVWSGA